MDNQNEVPAKVSSKKIFLYSAFILGMLAAPLLATLWSSHKVHILDFLPYTIFLLCPILHLFLHRKHGKGE